MNPFKYMTKAFAAMARRQDVTDKKLADLVMQINSIIGMAKHVRTPAGGEAQSVTIPGGIGGEEGGGGDLLANISDYKLVATTTPLASKTVVSDEISDKKAYLANVLFPRLPDTGDGKLVLNKDVEFCDAGTLNFDSGPMIIIYHDGKNYPIAAWA